jgi:hypothetical protein
MKINNIFCESDRGVERERKKPWWIYSPNIPWGEAKASFILSAGATQYLGIAPCFFSQYAKIESWLRDEPRLLKSYIFIL